MTPGDDRFWGRVSKGSAADCWPWTGYLNNKGYGRLTRDGGSMFAHRLAYELAVGEIPAGLIILHSCDNPPCCNPAHLSVGTHADNSADMVAKGRQAVMRGERSGKAVLTDVQVDEIRRRYSAGEFLTHLAPIFGISTGYASGLVAAQRRTVGLERIVPPRSTAAIAEEAQRLYESGLSTPEVGARLGRNPATIYRLLRRRGVRMRGFSEAQRRKADAS